MLAWDDGILSLANFVREIHQRTSEFDRVTNNKKIEYYNIPAAFDIETSSFYDNGEKRGIMYCWQFGIDNLVTMGRTWDDFIWLLETLKIVMQLNENRYLVVYVHNLPYEFQFMRKHIKWEEVFIIQRLKPVYCRTTGIEFRCSLKLSGGKKLADVAKDLKEYDISKKTGDLDYSKIRHQRTLLTEKELKYCEYDIRVIQVYIYEKIKQDGDITKIPLTNTGYVRNFCRKRCFKSWKRYHNLMSSLTLDPDEFKQLRNGFQGGFTHANAHYSRKLLANVRSADIGSSYPGVMVFEKYPMSKSTIVDYTLTESEFIELLITKCCLFDIEIFNLTPRLYHEHPLSSSKCHNIRQEDLIIKDNGRIVMASRVKTTVTEQDYFTLAQFYKWDSISVSNLRYYEKEYLPKEFILAILEMYEGKTKLKGDKSQEINYMISKNMINANFGMVVTNPVRDDLIYENDEFQPPKPRDLVDAIEKYNSNIRRFLFYPWGVWVTAYARANLFSAIASIGNDYVYSDTDSVKYLNYKHHKKYFDVYNNEVLEKIKRVSEYYRIPIEKFMPYNDIFKERKVIGEWEDEGEYLRFKTIGAKRYIGETNNSEIKVTVAGPNKKKTGEYLMKTGDPFGNFDDELTIPAEYSGRLILTYINDETSGTVVDYTGVSCEYHELSSIHMENSDYSLTMGDYLEYLNGMIDISE